MGEARRKKERKPPIRPTESLDPIPLPSDRIMSDKQIDFCRSVLVEVLNDESCLSFSKPVDELWDREVLGDYFDKIKRPMDVGTVFKRLPSYTQKDTEFFDPNAFREECRLVFLNAILYNGKNSELGRLATKFLHYIDAELAKIPLPVTEVPSGVNTNISDDVGKNTKKTSPTASSVKRSFDPADKNMSAGPGDDNDDVDNDEVHAEHDSNMLDVKGSGRTDDSKLRKGEKSATKDGHNFEAGNHNVKASRRSRDDPSNKSNSDEKSDEGSSGKGNGHGEPTSEKKGTHDDHRDGDGNDERQAPGDVNEDGDSDAKDTALENAERERLQREIDMLNKQRSKANARIAEFELEKNLPLTYDENSRLRDEVEALPWEKSQKVVQILRKYVDEAVKESDESDPEFVTLEFSTVEPRLLREIEALIRPDPRLEKEKHIIESAQRDIESARRKLKRLNDGMSSDRKKKRSKKSR